MLEQERRHKERAQAEGARATGMSRRACAGIMRIDHARPSPHGDFLAPLTIPFLSTAGSSKPRAVRHSYLTAFLVPLPTRVTLSKRDHRNINSRDHTQGLLAVVSDISDDNPDSA